MPVRTLPCLGRQDDPSAAADPWPNRFWTAPRNTTEWSVFMTELALSGNALSKLMLKDVASKLRGAHIGESNAIASLNR